MQVGGAAVDTTGRVKVSPTEEMDMGEYLQQLRDESGQTMAEYAVVLGVITIAVVVTLGLLGTKITSVLNNVVTSM
jgi:Flp pilus assembly pilin Flp